MSGHRPIEIVFEDPKSICRAVARARRAIAEGDARTIWCEDGSGNATIVLLAKSGATHAHEVWRTGRPCRDEIADAVRDGIDPSILPDEDGNLVLVAGATYRPDRLALEGWTPGDGSGSEGYRASAYFDPAGTYLGPDPHGIEPILRLVG